MRQFTWSCIHSYHLFGWYLSTIGLSGMKYDLRKLEEVYYDVKIRGLTPNGESVGNLEILESKDNLKLKLWYLWTESETFSTWSFTSFSTTMDLKNFDRLSLLLAVTGILFLLVDESKIHEYGSTIVSIWCWLKHLENWEPCISNVPNGKYSTLKLLMLCGELNGDFQFNPQRTIWSFSLKPFTPSAKWSCNSLLQNKKVHEMKEIENKEGNSLIFNKH